MSEGIMDEEDVQLLKHREISSHNQPPPNAIKLFFSNEDCRKYNESIHQSLTTVGATAVAHDRIQGDYNMKIYVYYSQVTQGAELTI